MTFDSGRLIVCDHVLVDGNTLLADYRNNPTNCTRCAGRNVYYDLVFDQMGNIEQVIKTKLLRALAIKAVVTDIGSNPFHPNYGTHISQYIGDAYNEIFEFTIKQEIIDALTILRKRQELQMSLGQVIDPDEEITEVTDITMKVIDGRDYIFYVQVRSASGIDITLEVTG